MQNISWTWAIVSALAAEILLIVCAVLWVFIYSTFINPGQSLSTYESYAQTASPYVAIIVSFPLFLLLAWWVAHRTNTRTVWCFFAIWFILDLTFVLSAGGWQALIEALLFSLLALAAKVAGTYVGMRQAIA
ncbi:MAG: hypothetical protein U0175_11045 [Caldilineaceae bacterium]